MDIRIFSSKVGCVIALSIVFLLSFSMKFLYSTVAGKLSPVEPIAQDTIDYLEASDDILSGKIVTSKDPDLTKRPGFPVYLSLFRIFIGDNLFKLRVGSIVIYSIISVLACWLSYKSFGLQVALLTSPFTILSPLTTFWSSYVLTESLFSLLLIICMISLVNVSQSNKNMLMFSAIGGGVFGLASWTRPVLIMFVLVVAIWGVLVKTDDRKQFLKNISVFIIVGIIVYVSWGVRNVIVTNNFQFQFTGIIDALRFKLFDPFFANAVKIEEFQALNISEKAIFFARNLSNSFVIFWNPSIVPCTQTFWNSNVIRFFVLYYWPSFALMVFSVKYLRKDFPTLSLFWLLIVYFTIVHTTMAGWPNISRYRVPIEPYISILAGYSSYQIYLSIKKMCGLGTNRV